jgi:hypothetical protein
MRWGFLSRYADGKDERQRYDKHHTERKTQFSHDSSQKYLINRIGGTGSGLWVSAVQLE